MQRSGIKALIIGHTGAVGRCTVAQLLRSEHVDQVTTIGRRTLTMEGEDAALNDSPKLHQHVIDMEKMEEHKDIFEGHDVGFCCLGTTRAAAGSAEAFRRVDLGLATTFATLAKAAGVQHMHLVSSAGANPRSWFLYMKTKGEVEEAYKDIGFDKTSIYRPGMLDRGPLARRIEKIASWIVPTIHVRQVAASMIAVTVEGQKEAVTTYYNTEIRQLA